MLRFSGDFVILATVKTVIFTYLIFLDKQIKNNSLC